MDSSTFKRFSASVDNILENLEDIDFTALGTLLGWCRMLAVASVSGSLKCLVHLCDPLPSLSADDEEIPQELLLGKHQLAELGSESAKIKAMSISSRVGVLLSLKGESAFASGPTLSGRSSCLAPTKRALCFADSHRQVGEGAEHPGEEHSGWG